MAVRLKVPSRVAALLPQGGEFFTITCAIIGYEINLMERAHSWKHRKKIRPGFVAIPHRERLAALIEEGCDTTITLVKSVHEWHLVGRLCGMLQISPGQWFLGCAGYNAEVEELAFDKMLAALEA